MTAAAIYELKKVACQSCHRQTAAVPGPDKLYYCDLEGCRQPLQSYEAPHSVPPCGPLMLHLFGARSAAQLLVKQAPQLPNGGALSGDLTRITMPFMKSNADVLRFCLSSSSMAFAYVAHRRYEEAIELLEAM